MRIAKKGATLTTLLSLVVTHYRTTTGVVVVGQEEEGEALMCDDRYCLSENCLASTEDEGDMIYPCEDGLEGRLVSTDDDEAAADVLSSHNATIESVEKYTCCVEGYRNIPVDILQTCSVDACASPDGSGGYDCSADGFIHPLVCDQDTIYKHARKETGGNIYAPYVCCTDPVGQTNKVMLVAASIWSVLCAITFIACSTLIVAILSSKKSRSQGYNLYLVFLSIPDALFNLFSFIRNVVNISGNQLSNPMGGTVHALEWFHTAANLWLNAFIIYQIHTMLLKARKFVRTPPPKVEQVLLQVGGIYFFAALWAAWSLILLLQGSNIFTNTNAAWLTSKSLMCGPPFLYTIGACAHVWWQQLLPSKGRTRVLSLYFLRVVLVFLLTWVPFLILVDVTYYKTASLWMLGLAYYFASLQGLLSVIVALGKPDINRAVVNLLLCRPDDFLEEENRFLGSEASRIGKSIIKTVTRISRRESSKFGIFVVSGLDESQQFGIVSHADEGKDNTEGYLADKKSSLDENGAPFRTAEDGDPEASS